MRKLILLLLVSILVFAGCTPATVTTPPASEPVAVSSLSPPPASLTTTPSSSPSPDLMAEKLALAPEIEGLSKAIETKDDIQKVVYRYIAGNPYGGKEGDYAGEFKKEVTEKNPGTGEVKEVGGVALKPNIVIYMWDEAYQVIDPGYVKKRSANARLVMVPLDISQMEEEDTVNISYASLRDFNPEWTIRVVVAFTGNSLAVVCPGKGENNYNVNGSSFYTELRIGDNELVSDLSWNIADDDQDGDIKYDELCEIATKFIAIDGDFIIEGNNNSLIENVAFGDELVRVGSHIELYTIVGLWDTVEKYVMRVGDSIVFMEAN